ncbi:MAG: FAD-binding protein [Betaproteobacteria bacterium]|nr:FAD-binding protein [Betaproteobacteria bacterium]
MSARLPPVEGEWIDRSKPLVFRFEGRPQMGFEGDVISSALWASGAHLLGRSFKYHRPRGILSMANHDVNTLMEDKFHINLRADTMPLREGMDLFAVNTFGGVRADRAMVLDKLSAFLPVGFYYKAFHGRFAQKWERFFRFMTGLGTPKFGLPRVFTAKRYEFVDVAVIGAGPSGLAAGIEAARAGASVLVVDENTQAGGSLGYARGGSDASYQQLQTLLHEARQLKNLEIRNGTTASGYYDDHWIALTSAHKMSKLRARAAIVTSGVFEQPAVFRNNDLPGVMFASAAQRLIYRYAVKPMNKAVVLTANREGYEAALDLHRHGIAVAAVVDLRAEGEPTSTPQSTPFRVLKGACIVKAIRSGQHVSGVRVAGFGDGAAQADRKETIRCDGVVMSVGFAPAANLLYQAGTQMRYDARVEQFVPETFSPGVFAAGRVNGVYELNARLLDGKRAGAEAARYLDLSAATAVQVPEQTRKPTHPYPIVPHPSGKNFVDFDEDLQLKDFHNAAQEGFDNIELLKRYSTVGMGPSQGKHSNMNAVRILARIRNEPIDKIGTTTARPFYHPVPMSHLAGRGFHPMRQTPLHSRHEKLGAVWMQAGNWWRPEYYAAQGRSKLECVRTEARAVRNGIGIIDVGTLGKMDLFGPDAGEFLERVYTGRFANIKVGMTRYCVMLDEAGVIMDDGVVGRLSEQHFYFTTTTTGSATVYRELVRWNAQWGLDTGIVNVTGAMGAVNLAGPKSREVLSQLTAHDLSAQGFPYLGIRNAQVAGVPCRLMRVGFVGELGYEIHAPAECMGHLWDALMEAGNSHGIQPFGVEAQRLLRLEKGHVIIGQDTDGLTTPFEAAMGWAVKMDKPFFVGQRSLRIIGQRPPTQVAMGFVLAKEFAGDAPKECHLIIHQGQIAGRVTSISFSEALGRHAGLGFIVPELAKEDTAFTIRADGGHTTEATVVKLPFYDPSGERQKL